MGSENDKGDENGGKNITVVYMASPKMTINVMKELTQIRNTLNKIQNAFAYVLATCLGLKVVARCLSITLITLITFE